MLGFPIGLLYANAGEWFIHKHVLHGTGKNKKSMWAFHFHEHHRAARKHRMLDEDYNRSVVGWHAQGKEALGVVGLAALHLPLFPVAPFFTGAVVFSAYKYYTRHKRSHEDPEWARQHLTWHYDHHMGPNQDSNWCVTWPWFDHVMGTREPYAFTEREAKDLERARQRAERAVAREAEAA